MKELKRILSLVVVLSMLLSVSVFADYEEQAEENNDIPAVEAAVETAAAAVETANEVLETLEAIAPETTEETDTSGEAIEAAAEAGDLDALAAIVEAAAESAKADAGTAKAAAETTQTAADTLAQQVEDGTFEYISDETEFDAIDEESGEVYETTTGQVLVETAQAAANAATAAAQNAETASENAANAADAAQYALENADEPATEEQQQIVDTAKAAAADAAEKSETAKAAAAEVEAVIETATATAEEAAVIVARAADAAKDAAVAANNAAVAAKDAANTIAIIRNVDETHTEDEVDAAKAVVVEKVERAVELAKVADEKAAIAKEAAERAKDVTLSGEEKAQAIKEAAAAAQEATVAANEAADAANEAADAAWELAEQKGWPFYQKVVTAKGVIVTARAQAGVFPKDAELTVEDMTADEAAEQMDVAAGDVVTAVDINFWLGGAKIQPDTSKGLVDVTIEDPNAKAVPTAVKTVKDGETETLAVEVEDGVVAFVAEHFTTYATVQASSVAKIAVAYANTVIENNDGFSYYDTLAEAIADAKDGATVTLLKDISVNAVIEVKNSLTIDGGYVQEGVKKNHQIATSATRALRIESGNLTLTLKNIDFIGGTATERGIQVDRDKTNVILNIDSCNVSGITYYAINICTGVSTHLYISNSDITGWGALNLWGAEAYHVEVSNSTLRGVNDKTYNAAGWNGFGVVVLEGDTTYQTDAHSSSCYVLLDNCEIIATQTTGNKQHGILFNAQSQGNVVEIKGANSAITVPDNSSPAQINGALNRIIFDSAAATSLSAVINTLGDNYVVEVADGNTTVRKNESVYYWWYTGGVAKGGYYEFNDPFEKGWLADGEFLDLLKDITLSKSLTSDKNYTLNFKGHDITKGAYGISIGNGKTVTTDKQTDIFTANQGYAVFETAGDNGTYTYTSAEGYTVTWNIDGTTTREAYGPNTTPSYKGATPTRAATAQYTYTFSGWELTAGTETGDRTYTAQFTPTLRSYTVTWQNWNGATLETDEDVLYGTTPTYDGATPRRADSGNYYYTFAGWGTLSSVTGDATYTAQFNQYEYSYSDDSSDDTPTAAPTQTQQETTTIEEEATPLAALPESLSEVLVAVTNEAGESVEVAVSELPVTFADVAEDSFARDAIAYVEALGLMNGTGSNEDGEATFSPTASTTGDMLATILYRATSGEETSGENWAEAATAWAADNNLAEGMGIEELSQLEVVSREQMVTVMYRVAEARGFDVAATNDLLKFTDAGDLSDYARAAMEWAVSVGLIKGTDVDKLSPNAEVTREQIALILMRFNEMTKDVI